MDINYQNLPEPQLIELEKLIAEIVSNLEVQQEMLKIQPIDVQNN